MFLLIFFYLFSFLTNFFLASGIFSLRQSLFVTAIQYFLYKIRKFSLHNFHVYGNKHSNDFTHYSAIELLLICWNFDKKEVSKDLINSIDGMKRTCAGAACTVHMYNQIPTNVIISFFLVGVMNRQRIRLIVAHASSSSFYRFLYPFFGLCTKHVYNTFHICLCLCVLVRFPY